MVGEMIFVHSVLVQAFLAFLVSGLFIPFLTAKNPLDFRKASFVYTMIFQAITTMIAFTGLITMVAGDFGLTLSTIIMIVIWAVLMYIEIRKYIIIKKAKIENLETHTLLKSAFLKISVIHILLIVVMVVLMILKAKGIVVL